MDIAIVTGASGSLGLAISKRLIQLGFRVYGLGGDYKDFPLQNVNFRPLSCDLADPAAVESACQKIMEKEKGVYVVINNAKYFGRHAFLEMDNAEIERILRINLLCPLVLARYFAESLKVLQGYLIQLGAPSSESCSGGAVGAASSGGLKWMGEQLFSELRSSGVRVCHLSPEPNRVADARKRIRRGARTEASIDPEAVAQAIEQILQSPFGNVVTDLVLRPLRIDEPDMEPVVKLPYPDPQPIPYTVPREFIEAEEQLEEEEWKKQQEKRKQKRRSKSAAKKVTKESTGTEDGDKPAQGASPQQESKGGDNNEKPASSSRRRRARRKPRPPRVEVGFMKPDSPKEDPPAEKKEKDQGKTVKKAARKAPKKATARKAAAKKAPKGKEQTAEEKTPAKKATVKKSARKAATKKIARKAVKKSAKKVARRTAAKKSASSSDNGKESA